jgi:flavin-dependent dehydrogenase
VTLRGNEQHCFTIDFERSAHEPCDLLVLPRVQFDDLLRQRAEAAGAVFFPNTRVLDVREEQPAQCRVTCQDGIVIHARIVVLATGAESQLLRHCGMLADKPVLEHAARVYFENVHDLDDRATLFFDRVDLPGYGWIFPMTGGRANIGCGVFDPHGPPQGPRLRELLRSHPLLVRCLANARQSGPIQVYPLRTDFNAANITKGMLWCVGEAAGLVNPVTGEGIDYALESAEFLAQAIGQHWRGAVPDERSARAYRRALDRRFTRRFAIYHWIRRRCLSRGNAENFISAIERSPALKRTVVNGLFGRARPIDFLRPNVFWPTLRLAFGRRDDSKGS